MDQEIYFSSTKLDMKRHWIWLACGIISGWSLYMYLYFSRFGQLPGVDNVAGYVIVMIVSIVFALLFQALNQLLDKRVSWKAHFIIRFSTALLGGLLLILIATILGIAMAAPVHPNIMSEAMESQAEWIKLLVLSTLLLFIFEAAYFSVFSYQQYAVVQINKYASERDQLRLQFEALKSQLSPHFLFNSLNTISSLAHKNPTDAEEFIRRLAVTYRYVISNKQQQLVKLEDEVEFIKSYYHLLKVRFEDSLRLEINLPKNVMQSEIPPMTLQILIENAVKHNQVDDTHRLDIYINAIDDVALRVTNNKNGTQKDVPSFKVGLENIQKRYAYYSGTGVKIHDAENFSVELPVIKKEAS